MGAFAFCIRISPSHEFMGFLALHRNIAVRQRPIFRRRYHAPLSQTCTAGVCACSCKSRRAPRPRKPNETLSRHGLGARRVALLAPRGVLNQCRHPLGYVGAITKILSKVQKSVPHFGRCELYSEWGRSPGGEEGVSYSHVRGWQLVFIYEHAAPFERVPPETKSLIERPRARRSLRVSVTWCPRRDPGEGNSPPKFRRRVGQLRRGAGDRSARVFIILFSVVVKGAKNFAALSGRLTIALYHAQQHVYNITQQLGGVGV